MRLIYDRGDERIAYPLEEGETYIGRKEYCDIFLPDASLSKRHARVVRQGQRLLVFDAGSRNGTLVNGERIDEAELRGGDLLQCGKVQFYVEGLSRASGSTPGSTPGGEFDILEGSDDDVYFSASRSRGGASLGASLGDRAPMSQAPVPHSRAPSGSVDPILAKAIASQDVRASVLGVLPEVASQERAGAASGETEVVQATLTLVEGGPERTWTLNGDTITIGSKEENTIVLTGEGISRYHAEAVREADGWVVKDLGSRNGIFVAGDRVDLHELVDGDEVQIGTCRLRFKLNKRRAGVGIPLLDKFLKDPKAALKEEPQLRMGLAVLVTALLLGMMAIGGGGGGGGPDLADATWCEAATAKLQERKFREARSLFRQAITQNWVSNDRKGIPRHLAEIADEWENSDKPLTFRWEKAGELLAEAFEFEDLPAVTVTWLEEQRAWVDLNGTAYDTLADAERLGREASGTASTGDLKGSLTLYEQALARYRDVHKDSLFAERATGQALGMRRQVFSLMQDRVNQLMAADRPEWPTIRFLIRGADVLRLGPNRSVEGKIVSEEGNHYQIDVGYEVQEVLKSRVTQRTRRPGALDYTEANEAGSHLRAELNRIEQECLTNQQDEISYQRGVDIVAKRAVRRYSEAVTLFNSVNRTSKIYPDAQAYIEWIDADILVREAHQVYNQGNERRAIQLLEQALDHSVLGPDARRSVEDRLRNWGLVFRAYNRGIDLKNQNRIQEAIEEFQRVLQYEESQANAFHARARTQIEFLRRLESLDLNRKLDRGLRALSESDHRNAVRWFKNVRSDPNHSMEDLERIRQAVLNANREQRILYTLENLWRRDESDRILDMYYMSVLLKTWLPPGEARERAEEIYDLVKERIERLQHYQNSRGGRRN